MVTSELPRDDLIDLEVDASLLRLAATFGAVSFPPGMPDYQRIAILEKAGQDRNSAEDFFIDKRDGDDNAQKREDKRRDNLDYLVSIMEDARDRERAEWARTEHSFAGVKMTGAAWGELASDLKRNGPLRDWLVQRLMREGGTKGQAEQKASEFADVATIMSKSESERTAAEREKMARAETDPVFRKVLPELQAQRLNGPDTLARREVSQTKQTASVASGADIFASAPNLTAQHQIAMAATKPLDAPQVSSAPVVLPPAPAGLDV